MNVTVSGDGTTEVIEIRTGLRGPQGDPGTTDYNELENLPDLTLKADKATTYTKIEVDTALAGKAETIHVHTIADVTGLQSALDDKSATNHTHTAANITDFDAEVSNNIDVAANTAARHTHANKAILDATTSSFTTADETKLDGIAAGAQVNTVTSVAGKTGAVTLDKSDVGLSNVDNTSDANKPISTATQTALDTKATTTALNAHTNNTTNPHSVTKAQVGLGNVDNTSDANKPVSTAQQTALDGKANFPSTDSHVPVRDGSGAQSSLRYTSGTTGYTIGFRTADGQIGVGAPTDNTHATNKEYVDTALNAKATKLTMNEYTVPFRDVAGAGEPTTSVRLVAGNPEASSVARRAADGRLKVSTATESNDATTKAQMDAADALKVNKAGDIMTGQLGSSLSNNMGYAQSRGGNNISFGTSAVGNFVVYNTTAPLELFNIMANGGGIRLGNSSGIGAPLIGTGFPNGVVSAPVGSTYVDTAVTNGASSWIKKSGTGNTGWSVLAGDTGWRDVTAELFSSHIEVVSPFDCGVLFRKTAETVIILIKGGFKGATFSGQMVTLPSGFRPHNSNNMGVQGLVTQISGSGSGTGVALAHAAFQFVNSTGISAGTRIAVTMNFPPRAADSSWPTTLPGVAWS